jgi:hypothetical protein
MIHGASDERNESTDRTINLLGCPQYICVSLEITGLNTEPWMIQCIRASAKALSGARIEEDLKLHRQLGRVLINRA